MYINVVIKTCFDTL